jgi:hypothetical protein
MVSTDHYDRHSAAKPGQRGRYMKAAPGDHVGVREPEVEEVAVHEQAVAQGGDGLEELEQRLLDRR